MLQAQRGHSVVGERITCSHEFNHSVLKDMTLYFVDNYYNIIATCALLHLNFLYILLKSCAIYFLIRW